MVGLVGSAAQQISSNLTKLKASKNAENTKTDTDLEQNVKQDTASASDASNASANLSSKVSQSLIRLKKTNVGNLSELTDHNFARNGVDVMLSKEARKLLKTS